MGLGKTIQSLTVVFNEAVRMKRVKGLKKKPVSLVICPTSLTYNWLNEINKFFEGFNAVVVEGTPAERELILKEAAKGEKYDLLIMNYEKVKNCLLQGLGDIPFFYLVLDEAHKIKNSKTSVTQSVKKLKADRKLALSGTPLQNRVSELWSLFDFLMPDFLEEEGVFNKKYNKYLSANIKKMQEKLEETQQFIDALKSLKKRIAPFILRRTKD